MALHNFVVKVTVFMKAVDSSVTLDEGVAEIFTQYANALAEQGLLVTAAKYCRYVVTVDIVWILLVKILPFSRLLYYHDMKRHFSGQQDTTRSALSQSRKPCLFGGIGIGSRVPFYAYAGEQGSS